MADSRSTLRSLIGVVLTTAALSLVIHRVAGGAAAWRLPLSPLVLPALALNRR